MAPIAYIAWSRTLYRNPLEQWWKQNPLQPSITALNSQPSHTNNPITIRLSSLHKCASQLSEHTAGLLTICLSIYHLCELFPNRITVHVRQNSSSTAYINSGRPINNATNPSQLLLQISRQQKEKISQLYFPSSPFIGGKQQFFQSRTIHYDSHE